MPLARAVITAARKGFPTVKQHHLPLCFDLQGVWVTYAVVNALPPAPAPAVLGTSNAQLAHRTPQGKGFAAEAGEGPGRGFTVNVPWSSKGVGDQDYLAGEARSGRQWHGRPQQRRATCF